jgi:hypothetical protein
MGDHYVANGITPHFDIGNIAAYHALGIVSYPDWVDDYTSTEADEFLVPSELARGGEVVDERACDPEVPTCQFPAFPGTVGWKVGVQLYRDAPVANNGDELPTPEPPPGWDGRRRFDRNRRDLVHYVLNAHYRGKPRSVFPCLDTSTEPDTPIPFPSGTSCTGSGIAINPNFHVPTSSSGAADLPGANTLITLGFWDEFVGRPFVRASTKIHELGHNMYLWHGGGPAVFGNKALNTATFVEPNCKPDYLSSMSYLFQVHGLFDNDDDIHLAYSGTRHDDISETTAPSDLPLSGVEPPPFRTAWFAPAASALASDLGVSAARRYCNGLPFDTTLPAPSMARVSSALSGDPIDWNGDAAFNAANPDQDVNFDRNLSAALSGFNDWANLRLDQIGAGRHVVKFQGGDLLDLGSGDLLDLGSGDLLDLGSGDLLDLGSGDLLDLGSGVIFDREAGEFVDFGTGDLLDLGSGDLLDLGSGDLLDLGSGAERQELDFESARALGGGGPFGLRACVIGTPGCTSAPEFSPLFHRTDLRWKAPPLGHVFAYHVSRKRGIATSSFPFVAPSPSTSSTPAFVDFEQLPNGVPFTYKVRAEFDDVTPHEFSGFTRTATILAVNNPPTAVDDNYTMARNTTLNVAASGVLANDTDVDSPASFLRAVLTRGPESGTVTLNANGSFSYTPQTGFVGVDRFKYVANNGFWSGDPTVPLSSDSISVDVVITVTAD